MVNLEHTPKKQRTETILNYYTITGDSISEIVEFCLPRIRQQSQEFYREHIKEELLKKGSSGIDRHAGMGVYYNIKLTMNTIKETLKYKLVEINGGYTVIRNKDNKGLVLSMGDTGKRWANKLREAELKKFDEVNDYEFETSDDLISY